MNSNRVASHQLAIEAEGKFLQASQQLQQDKQTYGSDHIHRYVDDVEGDWLENWTWEDDLADYIDAFEHHCSQKNYQLAIETLNAGLDLLKKPENLHRGIELYGKLVQLLKMQSVAQLDVNLAGLLEEARERLLELEALPGNNAMESLDFQESFTMNDLHLETNDSCLESMQSLLKLVHNGIIRKSWKFELCIDDDPANYIFEKKGVAETIDNEGKVDGKAKVELSLSGLSPSVRYFLTLQYGTNVKQIIFEKNLYFAWSSHKDEFQLIDEYLEKLEKAKYQQMLADIRALPE